MTRDSRRRASVGCEMRLQPRTQLLPRHDASCHTFEEGNGEIQVGDAVRYRASLSRMAWFVHDRSSLSWNARLCAELRPGVVLVSALRADDHAEAASNASPSRTYRVAPTPR